MGPRRPARAGLVLGAHESIAGGAARAFERAAAHGAQCVQIFTRSARSYGARPLDPAEARAFRAAQEASGLIPLAHGSYLVNLATEDKALREKSLRCALDELVRCEALGVPFLVYHPGAHPDPRRGVRAAARALDEIHRASRGTRVRILLENTAGQGGSVGWRFEELADILAACATGDRLGLCLDTCHLWAAGYDMSGANGYSETMKELDRTVGLERVCAFHLNDSKKGRGARVDRHENIGAGTMGTAAFAALVRDRRFAGVPGVLETPGPEHDLKNLALLRRLAI